MGKKVAEQASRRAELREVASHPLRLRLLGLLHGCTSPQTQREMGRRLSLSTAAVHYHLKKLLEAGLVRFEGTRPGPKGITEKLYAYKRGAWQEVSRARGRDEAYFLLDYTFACMQEMHREAAELIKNGRAQRFVAGSFETFASLEDVTALKAKVWAVLWQFHKKHRTPARGDTRPVAVTCAILPSEGSAWTGAPRVFDMMPEEQPRRSS